MAQLSTTMSHAHRATTDHFFTSKRFSVWADTLVEELETVAKEDCESLAEELPAETAGTAAPSVLLSMSIVLVIISRVNVVVGAVHARKTRLPLTDQNTSLR